MSNQNTKNADAIDPHRNDPATTAPQGVTANNNVWDSTRGLKHENRGVGADHLGGAAAGQRPWINGSDSAGPDYVPQSGSNNAPSSSGRGEGDANDNDNSDPRGSKFPDGMTWSSRKDAG
jgi:hypothetical protein